MIITLLFRMKNEIVVVLTFISFEIITIPNTYKFSNFFILILFFVRCKCRDSLWNLKYTFKLLKIYSYTNQVLLGVLERTSLQACKLISWWLLRYLKCDLSTNSYSDSAENLRNQSLLNYPTASVLPSLDLIELKLLTSHSSFIKNWKDMEEAGKLFI
jgi:hypothetical protein